MKGSCFVVVPSEWYENFPVTIAEAFACGTPVIASRLGAMQEIIEDGRTGLLFRPGDSEALADKVSWAWNHSGPLREMAEEARREYQLKYTRATNYPQLMRIYQSVTSSQPVTASSPQ